MSRKEGPHSLFTFLLAPHMFVFLYWEPAVAHGRVRASLAQEVSIDCQR